MKIKAVMTRHVFFLNQLDNLSEAARLMWDHDFGSLPVLDDEKNLVGMITDRDIAMAAYLQNRLLADIQVASIMAKNPVSCQQDEELFSAENAMQNHKLRRLPVLDEEQRLVGIICLNDIALAYKHGRDKEVNAGEVADTLAAICNHRGHEGVVASARI
ncbi:CBS domain-containing protein [Bowmanella dokdonensis]|uniref:CBS domain-containing protein n=1 Tax=Bowmanella dokdonensis TaxID=751969 RepID=A0A939ISL7_9ALTE|nr:CBS domain-containing protein [Bowmanella dokdonensis]MBN7826561.1 CBS domain-containing protein [Bowmanella dokdonensis]